MAGTILWSHVYLGCEATYAKSIALQAMRASCGVAVQVAVYNHQIAAGHLETTDSRIKAC